MTNPDLPARIQALLGSAVANLDPDDRAERIAWCQANNEHGVRMHTSDDDGLLDFRWGGRTLAMVRAEDLAGDEPLVAQFVPAEVPDTVPDEWTEQ
jgi:hypothetical protein